MIKRQIKGMQNMAEMQHPLLVERESLEILGVEIARVDPTKLIDLLTKLIEARNKLIDLNSSSSYIGKLIADYKACIGLVEIELDRRENNS